MKKIEILLIICFAILANISFAQLNPENYVEFKIRKKAQSGKSTKVEKSLFSSLHYIQPQSQIQIHFDKEKISQIENEVKIKVSATLIKVNGEEVPLEVFGFAEVKSSRNPQKDADNAIEKLEIDYDVTYFEIDGAKLSNTEVDVSALNLAEGDRIKVIVYNIKDNPKIGYSMVFEIDNFGWNSGPSGGFSFLKTISNNNINFKPSPNIGWSFTNKPHKGRTIWEILFIPSFGPELTVVDFNDQTTFGIGFQVSELANTVKFGYGFLANYDEENRGYFTIGFNFIDGINTIKALKENK
jgi:hypothetical protein